MNENAALALQSARKKWLEATKGIQPEADREKVQKVGEAVLDVVAAILHQAGS